MKLKGLPQKNITDFYNQTRNEILKLQDQHKEKLPQEGMYRHIQTIQKYEEYDLWLKDERHKALVEKLHDKDITIAGTTVGISITSRTLQTRKKVAKQQTQPKMEKHVSPESTIVSQTNKKLECTAGKVEQERIAAEKAEAAHVTVEKAT